MGKLKLKRKVKKSLWVISIVTILIVIGCIAVNYFPEIKKYMNSKENQTEKNLVEEQEKPKETPKPTSKVPITWQDNGIFSDYYEKAYERLETMSLEEKVGQLLVVRYNSNILDAVSNYYIGGTTFYAVNFKDKTIEQVKEMTSTLQNTSKIPMITAVDEEGGTVIRVSSNKNLVNEPFKSSQTLYANGGFEAITEDTKNKNAVLKSLGLNMNFAPVVDITSDKNAYIYKRTFGQNSELTGKYAETVIKASKNTGVSYSLKHFPGYGNNKDTHTSSSTDETGIEEFWNTHLIPFKVGIEAGAEAVMISHNIVSAVDKENISSLSSKVHDILRKDLKFTGIAITDDLDMDAAKNVPNKYRKALEAGNNIILCSEYKLAHTEILNAVKDGTITEDYLNQQVFKVLAWKYYKGLFE